MLRLENVQKNKREALVKVANMSVIINKLISKKGEKIKEEHHEDLPEIIIVLLSQIPHNGYSGSSKRNKPKRKIAVV